MSAPQDSIEAAFTAISSNNYGRAEAVLSAINDDVDRRSLRSLHLYAQVVEAQGRSAPVDSLLELARQVPADNVEEAHFLGEMASLLFQRKPGPARKLDKVVEYLDQALQLGSHPNDEMLLNNLCRACHELADYEKLVGYAEQLLAYPDSRTRAGLAGAQGSLRLQDSEKGAAFLDGVLENADQVDDAQLPWFIELLILFRRDEDAQSVIDKLTDRQHDPLALAWFQAQVRFVQHRFDDALQLLTEDLRHFYAKNPGTWSKILFMRGRCLDEAGDYTAAFSTFDAMNREVRSRFRITAPPGPRFNYGDFDYRALPQYAANDGMPYSPTFLIGFPRSGTTLLEVMLDSRDDVLTFSETQNVASARRLLHDWGMAYPGDVAGLSEHQVGELRTAYFEHNSDRVPEDRDFGAVIDKLPLNILHVPFILTLFPQAKFLLSLRHPLDAALSCFQQNFEMSVEMAHFTKLDDALARYDQVMALFDTFCTELDFPVLAVRYEELVTDVERVMTSVSDFLGLELNHSHMDFQRTVANKPVLTPSNTQVSREIYLSSTGRWRNYADQLLPHSSLVEAWINRYESHAMPGEQTRSDQGTQTSIQVTK
jgi:tetratricopeptide (TPR) repeat protein